MLKRLLAYVFLVFVVVGGTSSIAYFKNYFAELDQIQVGNFTSVSEAATTTGETGKRWVDSEEVRSEANKGFSVSGTKGLKPAAGQKSSANWPRFNGANRDNISKETGLLKKWPKGGPKLLWTAKGLGAGYSGVAVVDGVVYSMSNKGSSEVVMALDAGNGTKIWSTPYAAASKPSVGDGPRSTPTVDGNNVYGLGANGDLVALEAKSGKLLWHKNILQEYKGENIAWGICESVLIDGDKIVCTPGSPTATVVALKKQTGQEIWTCLSPQKDVPGYASINVTEATGKRQYVVFTGNGTIGVSANDGKFLWREDSANNGTANCSSPLVVDNYVFSASNYGKGGALVELSQNSDGVEAKLVYATNDMKSHHGDMVIKDGLIFGSNDPGILMCLDLKTGKIKWQNRSVGKGSMTYADGALYLRSENGPIALVAATGEGYIELGQFDQPDRSTQQAWTHPVVAEGKLFIRDQDLLMCYDLKAR